jgi:hypothetical protein
LGVILHQFAKEKKEGCYQLQWNDEKNDLIMWKLNSIWMKILNHVQLKIEYKYIKFKFYWKKKGCKLGTWYWKHGCWFHHHTYDVKEK